MSTYFKALFIFLVLTTVSNTLAQTSLLNGTFTSQVGHLQIKNDSILDYKINYGTCIITTYTGRGIYSIKDTILTITTPLQPKIDTSEYELLNHLDNTRKSIIEFDNTLNLDMVNIQALGNGITHLDTTLYCNNNNSSKNRPQIELNLDPNIDRLIFKNMLFGYYVVYPIKHFVGKQVLVKPQEKTQFVDRTLEFIIKQTDHHTTLIGPYLDGIAGHYNAIQNEQNIEITRKNWLGIKRKVKNASEHSHVPKPVIFKNLTSL